MSAPVPPQAPPGYTVHALLGRGGQGLVYRATKQSINKVVALKALPPPRDAQEAARLQTEVAAGVSVAFSRHAVGVHHQLVEQGWTWLELDFCPGGSVADLLEDALPPRDGVTRTLALGRQAALGLADLHGQGYVHRDVKPGNLLLDHEGGVRLADFGVAGRPRAGGPVETTTQVGTTAYLAPELRCAADHTPASDVYALGLTLARTLPWLFPELRDPQSHPRLPLPPPADGLRRLVSAMTSPDPGSRPTAADAAQQLQRLAELPWEAVAPAAPAPPAARDRRPLVAAGLGALVLVAGAAVLVPLLGGDDEAAAPQARTVGQRASDRTARPSAPAVSLPPLPTRSAAATPAPSAPAGSPAAEPGLLAATSTPEPASLAGASAARPEQEPVRRLAVSSAEAACQLPDGDSDRDGIPDVDYDPENTLDGQPATAWVCETSETGQLVLRFASPVTVTSLGLVPGYDKVAGGYDRWPLHHRVTAVRWTLGGTSHEQRVRTSGRGLVRFALPTPVTADTVTMEVLSTDGSGAEYEQFGVSEVELLGR